MNCYKNGNTLVSIDEDGTKIRYVPDGVTAQPVYPESIDLKISNRCMAGCAHCFVAGTKVLMSDYTYKNIEDIKVGDTVIGFEEKAQKAGSKRHIEAATVLQTFVHVESELIKVKSSEGNEIISTPNHPFLSQGTMKNHQRKFTPIERIKVGESLYAYGFPVDNIDYDSDNYAIGYAVGSWVGDGARYAGVDKKGFDAYNCRFVTLDEEINDKVFETTSRFSNEFYRLEFKMTGHEDTPRMSVRSNKKSAYDFLNNLINTNIGINSTKEYCAGYLAGFCDSEGHVDNQSSIIRLTNTNINYLKECERTLDILGIEHVFEAYNRPKGWANWKPVYNVRIIGKYGASRFLWYARPVCKRKSFENYMKTTTQYHTDAIASKEIIQKKQYVYNLETSSHTYIANNFMVHNCHECSTPDGKHGDLNHPLLDTLHPYTELAIGGGNPLLHPDLYKFLFRMAAQKVICNITVHLDEFINKYDWLKLMSQSKFIRGIGVSIPRPPTEDEMRLLASLKDVVLHTIVGILDETTYETLADKYFNILLLGYKTFGRGIKYRSEFDVSIARNTEWLKKQVKHMPEHFRAVCFDNLAIEQLELRSQMREEAFNQMYMGGDGKFTMYIDLVENKYAPSSTSKRIDIDSTNIDTLFANVRRITC